MKEKNAYHVDETRPWFLPEAGWPSEVPKNIDFPRMTLYEMLAQTAQRHPQLPALWFLNCFMSYQQLLAHVDAVAVGLHRLGMKKGDVMALVLPSCYQFVVLYYACARLGIIVSGINPTWKPVEIQGQISQFSHCSITILDALYEPLLAPVKDNVRVDHVICTNIVDMLNLSPFKKWVGKVFKRIPSGPVPATAIPFSALLKETKEIIQTPVSCDDTAAYLMTGGTTGTPKAAVLTHFNCVSNALQVGLWMRTKKPGACMVGIIPLFHSFGMSAVMNASLYSGMWVMLFPKPPETEELLTTICRIAPDEQTYFPGVEILFDRIAQFEKISTYTVGKKIRACISGAGSLRTEVEERFESRVGSPLLEGYGLTEASPVVSGGPLGPTRTTGTIGLPLTGIEWKIMDLETCDRVLLPGEKGELVISGPNVMQGYLNAPEETRDVLFTEDGKRWLLTGDIGYMDDLGRVTLCGRKKQLIKIKGLSIFPAEVEKLISLNERVADVAVAGLPDRDSGEAVKAWVVPTRSPHGTVTEEALKEWCTQHMASYKVPKYIEFVEEIPRNNLGKILRRELAERDSDSEHKKYEIEPVS